MTLRALEKSIRVLEKSWKSPGNLFLKKGTNPFLASRGVKVCMKVTIEAKRQQFSSFFSVSLVQTRQSKPKTKCTLQPDLYQFLKVQRILRTHGTRAGVLSRFGIPVNSETTIWKSTASSFKPNFNDLVPIKLQLQRLS